MGFGAVEKDWRPFVYGGLASCTAEFGMFTVVEFLLRIGSIKFHKCHNICVSGTFPIDTTKTRLQVQGQHNSLHAELRYRGMTHALVEISKHEGYRALYAGWVSCYPISLIYMKF